MRGICIAPRRRKPSFYKCFRRCFRNGRINWFLSLTNVVALGVLAQPAHAGYELKDSVPAEAPAHPGEMTFGFEVLDHEIDESLDTLVPLASSKDDLFFLNPKLSVSDRMDPSVSLGLGFRHMFEGPKIIVGANLFYDSYVSPYDQHYNQFGAGVEVMSRWVDFRANYYLPEQNRRGINSKTTTTFSQSVTSSSTALGPKVMSDTFAFAGHGLFETVSGFNQTMTTMNFTETATEHFWEQYEQGMRGFDSELGFLVPKLDKYAELRVFGGYYNFDNPFGKNVAGFKGRVELRALPSITLDAAYYQNTEIIGSHFYYGFRVSTPFDLTNIAHGKNPFAGFLDGFKPQHTDEQERFAERMSENLIRSGKVALAQSKFIHVKDKALSVDPPVAVITGTPFSTTTAVTQGGKPITVTQVNSNATTPGDGTFEHPYQTLTLADADAVKRALVILWGGSTFNNQSITLALNQQLLGIFKGATNIIKTDQGMINLPQVNNSALIPVLSNAGGTVVTTNNGNTIGNLSFQNSLNAIVAPKGTTGLTVRNSTFTGMTGTGLLTANATNTTVVTSTFSGNKQDLTIDGTGTTIMNVSSTGATGGAIALSNTGGTTNVINTSINGAAGYGLQVTNSSGTHNISDTTITGGTGLGLDLEGGSGTFTADSKTTITNTGGAAVNINGGSTSLTYGGNITQTMNAPAVAVLGGHTGTATFQGAVTSTGGTGGLLFDNANGTYKFLGATLLTGGSNLQILDNSAGAFTFGTGTSITNGNGQAILVNNSTASMTYSGNLSQSSGTLLQVNNHSTGTLQFDTGTLTSTGGDALAFNNADGTYKFLGTANFTGNTGVSIVNGSDGTFQFDTATNITNTAGTAFFVNGGTSNVTYSGNITAKNAFALEVLNHSTGTIAFNTGIVKATGGNGVQYNTDSGTYGIANYQASNIAGTALEIDASKSGTFTFNSVTINGTTGPGVQLNTAGSVSILGGSINHTGGDGIFSLNTALTATGLNIGNDHTNTIAGIGIEVQNNDGTARTVNISNDNIRSNGSGIVTTDNGAAGDLVLTLDGNTIETLSGGSKAMNITGGGLNSTIVRSLAGVTVIGNGTGGGLVFNQVTFDASGTALLGTPAGGGTWNIGQGTAARVSGDGIDFINNSGEAALNVTHIFNTGGTGLNATAAGTTFVLSGVLGGGSTIDTATGQALNLNNIRAGLDFASVTSTSSGSTGATIDTVTGGVNLGNFSATSSGGAGLLVQNSSANVSATSITINNAGADGMKLSNNTGSFTVTGTTTINNSLLDGINLTGLNANSTVNFGVTNINGFGTNNAGIDFAGADVTATFGVTNIQNGGNGTGIDLSGTKNGRVITFATGSNIHDVNIGVELDAAHTAADTANATFTFGDGSNTDANGANSKITATTTVDAIGLVQTSGTYNFLDAVLTGKAGFASSTNDFFVSATATNGVGDGSFTNPYSVSDADAITTANAVFVFLDGNYNFGTLNGGNAFTLGATQSVEGFDNGNTVTFGQTQPMNVLGNFGSLSTTVGRTAGGSLTITNGGSANDLFDLGGSNMVEDITLSGTGNSGNIISVNGAAAGFNNSGSITITGVTIGNLTGAAALNFFNGVTGSVSVTGNNINAGTGNLVDIQGGNANYTISKGTLPNGSGAGTLTGGYIQVQNTTGGSLQLTGATLSRGNGDLVFLNGNAATVTVTDTTLTNTGSTTSVIIDQTASSTGKITFNGTTTMNNAAVTAFQIGAGARDIDASAVNLTNDNAAAAVVAITGQTGGTISFGSLTNNGSTGANVISSTGQTGGKVNFGAVNITGYNDAGGTAVNLQGTGTVDFGSTSITTTNGSGLSTGGITFGAGTTASISTTNGTALTMNGTTIDGGTETFSSVSATNAGAGNSSISLTNVTGTTTFTTVALSGTAGTGITLNNAGTVSVLGGTINGPSGDGIDSTNTALTVTGLTIGNAGQPMGNGITIVNNDGTARIVNLSNDTITSSLTTIKTTDGGNKGELTLVLDNNKLSTLDGGSLAVSVTGSVKDSTIVQSMSGDTVIGTGAGGGVLFNTVTFDASGTALTGTTVNAGNWNIGQGALANQRVGGNGLDLEAVTGNLSFGTLNIYNNVGTGLLVNTKAAGTTFVLGNTGGVINTNSGTAMNLDPLTANLTFSSITSINGPSSPVTGIILNTVSGTVNLGAVSVTGAAPGGITGAGISMVNSNAAVTASSVTVDGAATGLQFGANTGGSFTVSGATSLTNITGTGVNANGATGTYQFTGGLTIGFSGGGRGLDLRNSDVMFTTGTLAITGNGTAGSIGIDLSGSMNPNGTNSTTPNILLATGAGQTATINNVATGVVLGNAANGSAGAYMKYGNQTATSAGGSGSQINVIAGGTTIDTTHLTSTTGFDEGRYEFTGVTFTGHASFEASPNFFFVSSGGSGTGDGSTAANAATGATLVADLNGNTLANKTIVLINDGSAINLSGAANLDANDNIDGFGNGNSVSAFTIPVNVIIDSFTGTVTDPTGNGAATLTTASGHNLINLNGGNSIKNVNLSGGDFTIAGTSTSTNLTVQGTNITGGALGVFSFTGTSGTTTITNNAITSGGSLLTVNGGTASINLTAGTGSIANTGGSGISIKNLAAGASLTLDHVSVTGATATPLTFDHNLATSFTITNSTFGVNSGVTLLNVDATTASTTALTLGGTDTLTQSSGEIAIIGAGARNIDLSAQNFTNSNTTATNVINVTGESGGTISFGTVTITGYNNSGNTAVNLQGTGGAVNFASSSVTTSAGAGVNTGGITLGTGTGVNIDATGGSALVMNGTTITGSGFGTVKATNTGAGNVGINITNVASTFTIGSVAINGTGTVGSGAAGIILSGDTSVTISGGTINNTHGNGVTITNSGFALNNLTMGSVGPISGDGVNISMTDATNRTGTIGNMTASNVTGKGVTLTNSGTGTDTFLVTGSTISATGNAVEAIKSAAGNLVFDIDTTTVNSSGGAGLNVDGHTGAGVLTVSDFQGNTVGNAAAGGMLLNTVTFDADTTTAGIQTVNGGATNIGSTSTTTNVSGFGLELNNVLGSVAFSTLNIGNDSGTGLFIRGLAAGFTFGNSGGAIKTTNGTAMDVDPTTFNATFSSVGSTNAATGINLNTIAGTTNLGAVTVSGATTTALNLVGSSANVTLSSLTVTSSATGLTFGTNTGTFEVTGNTSLTDSATGISAANSTGTYKFDGTTGISAPNGIAANGAKGSWTFTGNTTINFSGANRGLDLRNTQFTLFQTGNITITGDGTTAGSIAVDLSGSKPTNGTQPVTTPNITLADAAGKTAAISGVTTGVLLGDATNGSAGAYFVYGNQTAGSSGSSIAVNNGGTTIDTTNLTSTTDHSVGRYEFTGVAFTGKASFEKPNTNFIFVGSSAAGMASGGDPNDRISLTTFLASDNTTAFLAGKTIIFVNDNGGADMSFGATTLNMGTNTVVEGFGNGATVVVPSGGTLPINVISDNFHLSGGSFTDANGAAKLSASAGTNVFTLGNGDTIQNINIDGGSNQIIGTGTAGFTLAGVNQTAAGASAISLTTATGTISMTGGSINFAGTGAALNISGGSAAISYGGTITNTAGHSVEVQNITGGSVTVSGAITDTGTGILVQNNTGGTVTFSGANDSIHTGANQAVTLATNTGATVDFTGGGLSVQTTGTAQAFAASGGGTVGMTGTGNTISSTTGFALDLNGVAIDTNGFTVQSVSANGGSGAITLGSLTGGGTTGVRITGTGSTAGSGGTIQNTTGTAISLSLLNSLGGGVTLNNMNITGGGGILGFTFGTLAVSNVSLSTTNAAALNLNAGAFATGSAFNSVSSTGSTAAGINLNAITGSVNLGAVTVTNATTNGLSLTLSSANVTASSVTVTGTPTGLNFGANTGTFEVTGNTSLTDSATGISAANSTGTYKFDGTTGITAPNAIAANGASGSWTFTGNTTISFTGANRGLDLRNTQFTLFQTGNITITGDGTTAGSIAVDLSGSKPANATQPVTTPNITLADAAGKTAAIAGVTTGILLGEATDGSAGAYFVYGNQTPLTSGGSGSSIAVNSGGATINTTNLTSTTDHSVGRYEFTGVTFTGQSTFEGSNPNFIFVGNSSAGADTGANPNNRISVTQFLASDNTSAFLAGKTIIFVNDVGVGDISFGGTTVNMGTGTTIEGFGNGATVVVPGGVQPINVIGDNFHPGGGSFTDANGAAKLSANAGTAVFTLGNGDTIQNINIDGGGIQVLGLSTNGFTMAGVNMTNSGDSAISLQAATGTISMTGGSISAAQNSNNHGAFYVTGGSATISFSGTITGSTGHSVDVTGITGGSVTLSGTITDTGSGILVQNNTGGTVTFSGANDSIHTAANQAVTLATNTGATVDFTGGGLSIQTTTATGFGASGGGTVGLTGTGNTITSTTGTALSLANLTIDTNGFVLQSVSANGAANGIALNNLSGGGTTGVQVTGTGATAGSGGTIQNTTGAAVSLTTVSSLGGGVTLDNMNITGGGGITGTTFGTLSVSNVSLSATNAAALNLTTGAFAAGSTFSLLSSTGATNGVALTGVTGSFSVTSSSSSISNESGAAFLVSGGSVSVTYAGGITQANNAAMINVTGGHTGTLTFNTGTLSATNGTGLVFNNADGTYNFNGTTTMNGGTAAISITNGSGGTFAFNANTSVTNPTATTEFTASGSTANVTFNGGLSRTGTSAGLLVDVTNETGGTITFQTGTLSSTSSAGTGINLTADTATTVNFSGTTTLNGGTAHVDINGASNSASAFTFGTGASITSPLATAFNEGGGAATVTYNGTINQSNAFSGVVVSGETGGTTTFGGLITTSTAGVTGVNLTNNAGATITFTGGLNLTTTTGTTFNASGSGPAATTGGTVNVTGTNNTLSSTTGTALNVLNTTIGASGLTFKSISATGSSANAGIILNNTGITGGLTVTGSGSTAQGGNGSGGTISNKTGGDILTGTDAGGQTVSSSNGVGIFLMNTVGASFNNMQLNDFTNFAIYGNNISGFNLSNSTISGTNGTNAGSNAEEASIRFDNLHTGGSFTAATVATITNSKISGGAASNLYIANTNGTLNRLVMTTNDIGFVQASIGNNNIEIDAYNTGTVLNYSFGTTTAGSGNTIEGTRASLFQSIANQGSTMDVVFRNNTLNNNETGMVANGGGVDIRSGASGGSTTLTFDISHNNWTASTVTTTDAAFFVSLDNDTGTAVGTINANTINALAAVHVDDGMFLRTSGSGTFTVLISNNTITNFLNDGIALQNNSGSATMNGTIIGNTITNNATGIAASFAAIDIENGATATDTSKMNIQVGSATTTSMQNIFGGTGGVIDIELSNFNGATTLDLYKAGSTATTPAGVIDADNPSGTPTVDTTGGTGTTILTTTQPPQPPAVAP